MTPTPHSASANTESRNGWTYIDGLADAHPGTVKDDYDIPRTDYAQAKPAVERLTRVDGTIVTRLAFRDGDMMADHSAAAPILILGQVGTIEVSIHRDSDGGTDLVALSPGSAVHIDAGRVHSVSAEEPATATLIVLG
ncbi:XRE family transcriptional regulator [Corynebacterium glyciniphilum]|uniref:XRE family transcriptional regulator n=1 Tax=Corynebacterium glyciniphilum TaxID=1404244 RepID=UPI003DA18C70